MQKIKISKALIAVIAGIILKVVLMGLFSSDYQNAMFEPFIGNWFSGMSDGKFNPYQTYYESGIHIDFPYPAIMLFIVSIGKLLCDIFADAPLFIHNVLFKLPLLVFDIIGYIFLVKLFPSKKLLCAGIYFFSPITLYSVYMHGQLDIIPMSFILISLYLISGKGNKVRFLSSALFASLALLSKFHIAAIIPLIVIYVAKRFSRLKSLLYAFFICIISALGILIFFGDGFINGVVFNNELSTLFALSFPYNNLSLYISLCLLAFIYIYILNLNIINRDLLFGFSGTVFAVFLALCVPMPGWFVWVVPFVSFFMLSVNCKTKSLISYILLQLTYLVYFVFFHIKQNVCDLYFLDTSCSFLKVNNELLRNIAFSMMICSLVYMIFLMYKFGIASNGAFGFHDKSFVIGICGNSSVGKTTLQDNMLRFFNEGHLLLIEGDGDHRWERNSENWNELTHLDPKANYLYRQAMDIEKLKRGQAVERVDYDHSTGKFTKSRLIFPKRFISISGLHTFYLPQLREKIDLRIFIDSDEELRCLWKLDRDSSSRGRTKENILEQIESRRSDAAKYIYPQRQHADIIIEYVIDSREPLKAGMIIYVSTKIDVEPIANILRENGVSVSFDFSENYDYQILEYHNPTDKTETGIDFYNIADKVIEHGYELIDKPFEATDISDGIRNLIILKAISVKMKEMK